MPILSVILPNYNHARYLVRRIESILQQTFQDFELIILDDKSTDSSREIIKKYQNNPKISHVIFNTENSGSTFLQWEKGIQLAKGNWIWIAESDDWCEPTLLENLMNGIGNNQAVGLAYVQSVFYYEETKTFVPSISVIKDEEVFAQGSLLRQKLLPYNSLLNAGMAIFKKELFAKVNPVYKEYQLAGDWVFWAEISQHCATFVCGKFLNYFRMHPVKVTYNAKKRGINAREDIKVLHFFKEEGYISQAEFDDTLMKSYFSFRYQKFEYDDGVVEKTDKLYRQQFSEELRKKIQKKIFRDKVSYKLAQIINKLLKF